MNSIGSLNDANYFVIIYRDVTEEELINIFSAHGNIVQMNLLKDKITGMPRGVAFVRYVLFFYMQSVRVTVVTLLLFRFDKREEAIAAIEGLNGTIPHGRANPISVKIAEEHGKQKAAYFAGWEAGRQQARRELFLSFL